ncbi:MAG: MoaD/ThiS family protein [Tuberibacillus sp.]
MIKILLFAGLKERVGQPSLTWEKAPISVGELKKEIQKIPGLENMAGVMIAVNEAFAVDDTTIYSGDTVALIPPVSGG